MSCLRVSTGLVRSASDTEGDILPPATPRARCLVDFMGLFIRHAFLMSISVVLTHPGCLGGRVGGKEEEEGEGRAEINGKKD